MRSAKLKTIIAVLCLAAMLFSSVPFTVLAAYENSYLNTGDRIQDIIGVAKTQVGYSEDYNGNTKYGTYMGWPDMDWCAAFVVWCAAEADVSTRIIPAESSCTRMKQFFESKELYHASPAHGGVYTPKAGDLAFFSSRSDPGYITHVGLVTSVTDGTVNTVEGNYSDRVKELSYSANAAKIVGFAAPAYDTSEFRTGYYTVRENTPVRSTANAADRTNVLTDAAAGAQLKVTSINGSWGKTEHSGKSGWVDLSVCEYVQPLTKTTSLAAVQSGSPLFKVVDVSRFTSPSALDWATMKEAGVQAAILRIGGRGYGTEKRLYNDVAFTQHYKNATAAGIAVGVYFFSYALNEAQAREEAEMVIRILQENDCTLSMPVFIDIEDYQEEDYMDYQHEKAGIDACSLVVDTFCNTISAAGYYPGVYCNKYFAEHLLHPEVFENRAVWIAHYGVTQCGYKGRYDLWQYTGTGRIDGYSGLIDISYCYVDFPSMIGNAPPAGTYGEHVPNDDWVIIQPTCAAEGMRVLTCKDCGVLLVEEVLSKTEHTPGRTYILNGNTSYKAGDVLSDAVLGSLHGEDDPDYAGNYYPAYMNTGGTMLTYCTECKTLLTAEYSYGAEQHGNLVTETINATCAAEGIERRVCTDCGRTVSETLLPLHAHTPGDSSLIITSCTLDGTRNTICAVCGETIRSVLVPPMTHQYDDGTLSIVPTLKTPGKLVHTCKVCGDKKTEDVAPPMYGDTDCDGQITANDARLALRATVKLETLSELQTVACDANNNRKIDSADARIILRMAVKLDKAEDLLRQYYP